MARLLFTLVAICSLFSIICQAGEVFEYTVLSGGNPAGFQKVKEVSKTEYAVEYEYNDRGRGPKLSTRLVLNPNSIPVSIQNTGNNYFKAPVKEMFQVEGNRATWNNTGEEGGKTFKEMSFT